MGRIPAYDHHVHAPNRPSATVITVGAALAIIGSFLPWIGTGASARSSYDVVDLVERLGFTPDGVMSWVLRVWPLAPLLLVLAAVAQWAPVGRTRRTRLTISTVSPDRRGGLRRRSSHGCAFRSGCRPVAGPRRSGRRRHRHGDDGCRCRLGNLGRRAASVIGRGVGPRWTRDMMAGCGSRSTRMPSASS